MSKSELTVLTKSANSVSLLLSMEPQYSQAQKCFVVFSINIYRDSHGPATVPCPKNIIIYKPQVFWQCYYYFMDSESLSLFYRLMSDCLLCFITKSTPAHLSPGQPLFTQSFINAKNKQKKSRFTELVLQFLI